MTSLVKPNDTEQAMYSTPLKLEGEALLRGLLPNRASGQERRRGILRLHLRNLRRRRRGRSSLALPSGEDSNRFVSMCNWSVSINMMHIYSDDAKTPRGLRRDRRRRQQLAHHLRGRVQVLDLTARFHTQWGGSTIVLGCPQSIIPIDSKFLTYLSQ